MNWVDPWGLEPCETFEDCFKRCISETYGDSFDIALNLSPFSLPALAQDAYNNLTETLAKDRLKSLPLEGAYTDGDITRKLNAANNAVQRSQTLSLLTKGLTTLSRASGLLGSCAGGYIVGASIYCSAKCSLR